MQKRQERKLNLKEKIIDMKTEEELYKKYSKIFPLMSDPYYSISSGIPSAWLETVDWMCEAIQNHVDGHVTWRNGEKIKCPQVVCEQIKEKFGGLRFYYHGGDDQVAGMVYMAETILWNTCEYCGSHEEIETTKGWITRVCKKCKEKK